MSMCDVRGRKIDRRLQWAERKLTVRCTIDSCKGDEGPRPAGPNSDTGEDNDGGVNVDSKDYRRDCSIASFTLVQGAQRQ
jgi:hypothetical protein